MRRPAALLSLLLTLGALALAACDAVGPSPVRTDCYTRGRNPIPYCPD